MGLIRSEYLLRRTDEFVTRPGVRAAMAAYVSALAEWARPRPVWYRTTDFWSNEANTLSGVDMVFEEQNPAIGCRGLRRALRLPRALEVEIAALLPAARTHDNLHLLLPFVGDADEFSFGLNLARGVFWPNQVGCMIEIPSAVLDVERIVEAGATNLLVGMNDLTCFMTGSARRSPFGGQMHPSVWWCLEQLQRRVGARVEWGIAGDLTAEVLEEAARCGVPYATVHYWQTPELLRLDAARLPDVDYVEHTKTKTRARLAQRGAP